MFSRSFRWLVAIALLIGVVSNSAWAEDCALKRLAEIPVQRVGNTLVFSGELDGRPVKIALDNGISSDSWIADKAVEKFGLTRQPLDRGDKVDPISIGKVSWRDLQIDRVKIDNLNPHILSGALPDDADIAVGPQAFANVDLELDLSRNRIALYSPDHCPGKVVYWSDSWLEAPYYIDLAMAPLIDASVNGNKTYAKLNLTFGMTTLTPYASWSSNIRSDEHGFVVDTLEFAGVRLSNVRAGRMEIAFADPVNGVTYHPGTKWLMLADLNLGLDLLKRFHFYIARNDLKVYFTPASDG